tara:strand:- start:66 stop:707 length:642 start_codon:yes stop_codon:yes gene_type:complete
MSKCVCITLKGTPCKNKAKTGFDKCTRHLKNYCPLTGKSFGQGIKNRASTSRNAINNSYAKYKSKDVTPDQIKNRDTILNIDPELCMYCRDASKQTDDHLIPACNRTDSIFGQNNNLNRIPCCKKCNSSKGGNTGQKFKNWLENYSHWSVEKIDILFKWIDNNKAYLYLEDEAVVYLKRQHEISDVMHDIMEKSCKNQEEIFDNLRNYFQNIN